MKDNMNNIDTRIAKHATPITLSPFATLPVVTFTNVHGDEPTHCVWIFQTVAEADAAADKLRSLRKIESVFVRDAPFKGAQ